MAKNWIKTSAFALALALGSAAIATNATKDNPETVVAKVNGKDVKMKDILASARSIPPQLLKGIKDEEKLFTFLRDQTIDMMLMKEEALKAGLEKDTDVQKAIEAAKEQAILQAWLAKQIKDLVTEKAIKERFDKMIANFPKDEMETKARHILVKDESEAKRIIERLKKGEDFMKLAREFSIDKGSAQEGGDIGYFRKGDMVQEFADAAFALKPGAISETPVKSKFGYHVIKIDDRRKVKPPKFEEAKDQLSAAILEESMQKLLTNLKDRAKIERFDRQGKAEFGAKVADEKKDEAKK